MKVKLNVNSGANIHSNNSSGWLDPVKDLGLDEGEWETLSDEDKWEFAREWADNYIEIYYEEDPDD